MSISPGRSFGGVIFLRHGSPVSQVKNQDLPDIWIFPKSGLFFWSWNSSFLLISISLFLLDIHQLPLIKPSSVLLLDLWFLEDQHYLLKFCLSYKVLLKHNLLLNPFPEAPMEYSLIHSLTNSFCRYPLGITEFHYPC